VPHESDSTSRTQQQRHITGQVRRENLWLRPESYYEQQEIELRLCATVTEIDRAGARVRLSSGAVLNYDHLVLALGSRNRALPVDGAGLDGVAALRTLADADAIRDRMAMASDVVVVGGGFIGMEVAATAVRLGRRATVIELADRLIGRVLSPPTSRFLLAAHRSRGLAVELLTSVSWIEGAGGRVTAVHTTDGRRFAADLVLVGIGAVPNVELAQAAGLQVANGIVVDEHLRTADQRISAIGDARRTASDREVEFLRFAAAIARRARPQPALRSERATTRPSFSKSSVSPVIPRSRSLTFCTRPFTLAGSSPRNSTYRGTA
jgi:3-phenylpropionate/trans-cinnamate dioxygenase ferredoxin reductase subunit